MRFPSLQATIRNRPTSREWQPAITSIFESELDLAGATTHRWAENMSAWSGIQSLARRFLGIEEPEVADLAKIDTELAPTAEPRPRSQRSTPAEAEPIEVLPEYEFVLEAIRGECPAIFVTGRAGTGKSTLIRFLTEQIKNCAVVAPTALAAINVHGSTIHSFFSIPPRTLNPDEAFEPRRQIVPVIEVLGALVIDEVSMVPPDLVDCISNTLKKVRRDPRPFGGVPVVFVGDLLQLPPVVSDPEVAQYYTDRYRSPYFFSADVFHETKLVPIELTKVFVRPAVNLSICSTEFDSTTTTAMRWPRSTGTATATKSPIPLRHFF